jgi:hypothetical protein
MFSLLTWRISTLRSGDIDATAIDFGSGGRRCRDFGSWGRHRQPDHNSAGSIEVQHSNLSVLDIERRTKAYMAAGVPVIWIGLMNWGLLGIGDRSLNGYYVMNYRSRDWEKWAHNYNGGHLWLLDVNVSGGEMWRASFQGGATILEGPFGIQSLHIKFFKRMRSLHGRIIPVAYGAWLLAPRWPRPCVFRAGRYPPPHACVHAHQRPAYWTPVGHPSFLNLKQLK